MSDILTRDEFTKIRKEVPALTRVTKYPKTDTTNPNLCEKRNKHFEKMELKRMTKEVYDDWD